MSHRIVFGKDVVRKCTAAELSALEQDLRTLIKSIETKQPPSFFYPWPPSKEDATLYADQKITVTFTPRVGKRDMNDLVMLLPLHFKDDQEDVWYVGLKGRGIELNLQQELTPGHYRLKED